VRQGLSRPFWLALVIAAFCLPLFIGLGRTDLENDEAIYSFAVDEILANGDWLNPRLSPDINNVFLEKPPLKFWIVAAPIRLGLLPHDEFGLRFWDALFGAIAFLYVFALGRRVGGPVCGAIAVMVLFVYGPLLFQHGLRGNNMEAPLMLCYCGAVFHYVVWAEAESVRARRWQLVPVALYFLLGFMTKFVAALFLPVFLSAAALSIRETRLRLRQDWVAWLGAALLVVVLAAPWFVYEYKREGEGFWRVILKEHVYTRFTTALDPSHVQPWDYYYRTVFNELQHMGMLWLVGVGAVLLCAAAFKRTPVLAVTIIAWFAVPLALMSLGTSKLHHYAYPFLPPLALAAGYAPAWLLREARGRVDAVMQAVQERLTAPRRWSAAVRNTCAIIACLALVLAVLTFVLGGVTWKVGGVIIFRNGHIARPLLIALILGTLAGRGVFAARLILPVAVLLLLLPANAFEDTWRQTRTYNQPLHVARDCLMRVHDAEIQAGRRPLSLYAVGEHRWFLHSYYYYLRHLGWDRAVSLDAAAVQDGLFVQGRQRPVLLGESDYRAFKAQHLSEVQVVPALPLRESLLLMPGPYAPCAPYKSTLSPFN
jgi:4-amino-4-deoxy-L-arabinose transferase-like glycosyltransferase